MTATIAVEGDPTGRLRCSVAFGQFGQRIDFGRRLFCRRFPLRTDPAFLFELVQSRVERTVAHLQNTIGDMAEPATNREAVQRLDREDFQQQEIQGSLDQIGRFACYLGYRYESTFSPLGKQGEDARIGDWVWGTTWPAANHSFVREIFSRTEVSDVPNHSSLSSQARTLSFRSTRRILHVFGQPFIFRANHPGDEGDGTLAGHRRADRSPRGSRTRSLHASRDSILAALKQREETMSTGIGFGIAIPHASSERSARSWPPSAAPSQGIEFDALDNAPVKFVVLFIVPKNQFQTHLRTLGFDRQVSERSHRARKPRHRRDEGGDSRDFSTSARRSRRDLRVSSIRRTRRGLATAICFSNRDGIAMGGPSPLRGSG